jgi:hypothetical protein
MKNLLNTAMIGLFLCFTSINLIAQRMKNVVEFYSESMELVQEQDGYFAYKTYTIDKKGRKSGLSQMYTSNNVLIERIEYKKDRIIGEVLQYNSSNKTIESGKYTGNKKVGLWEVRSLENEILEILAFNENGEKVGVLGPKDTTATIIESTKDVDTEPSFPGGQQEWLEYQRAAIQPTMDTKAGTAAVKMILWQDGSFSNIIPDPSKNTPNFPLTGQLIRLFKNSPKWIPAMKDGKAIPYVMTFSMSITIRRKGIN